MTVKQREFIKNLMADESEFGYYNRHDDAIAMLGGGNWEDHYETIDNKTVNSVIGLLCESLFADKWAIEHGYD